MRSAGTARFTGTSRLLLAGTLLAVMSNVATGAAAGDGSAASPPAHQPAPSQPAQPAAQDSATFDSDGTAHLIRVVPEPSMVSPEARKWLDSMTHNPSG